MSSAGEHDQSVPDKIAAELVTELVHNKVRFLDYAKECDRDPTLRKVAQWVIDRVSRLAAERLTLIGLTQTAQDLRKQTEECGVEGVQIILSAVIRAVWKRFPRAVPDDIAELEYTPLARIRADLLVRTVYDSEGGLLFTEEDIPALMKKSPVALDRLWSASVGASLGKRWIWPAQPLRRRSWGNLLVKNDGTPTGQTIKRRRAQGHGQSFDLEPGDTKPPGTGVLSQSYYVPTDDDIELLKKLYPKTDPYRPSWDRMEADLVVEGHKSDDLRQEKATTLLRLLEKVRCDPDTSGKSASSKGGQRGLSDTKKKQRQALLDKWKRAKEAGTSQKDFCKDEGITLKDISRAVNWAAQVRRRESDS